MSTRSPPICWNMQRWKIEPTWTYDLNPRLLNRSVSNVSPFLNGYRFLQATRNIKNTRGLCLAPSHVMMYYRFKNSFLQVFTWTPLVPPTNFPAAVDHQVCSRSFNHQHSGLAGVYRGLLRGVGWRATAYDDAGLPLDRWREYKVQSGCSLKGNAKKVVCVRLFLWTSVKQNFIMVIVSVKKKRKKNTGHSIEVY